MRTFFKAHPQLFCRGLVCVEILSSFQLYEALNVGEHQLAKERELTSRLEILNGKIGPLEQVKSSV